jgi:hypothetical protein
VAEALFFNSSLQAWSRSPGVAVLLSIISRKHLLIVRRIDGMGTSKPDTTLKVTGLPFLAIPGDCRLGW